MENRINGLATSSQISELHARLDGMENQINARLDGMENRINARLNIMDNRLNDVTRVGVGIIIAILISVVGLIVAGITQ